MQSPWVKNGKTINPDDLRGLKEFAIDYPEATLFFIYRGKDKPSIARDLFLIDP